MTTEQLKGMYKPKDNSKWASIESFHAAVDIQKDPESWIQWLLDKGWIVPSANKNPNDAVSPEEQAQPKKLFRR